MALLAMKQFIASQKIASNDFTPEQQEEFDEILNGKLETFNPDIYLDRLGEGLLCIKINENSYLSEVHGTETICGRYIGMIEYVITRIRNEAGEYEEKEGLVCFDFEYPPGNIFPLTFYDLDEIDEF